jgi:hypothetical protein
MGTVMNYEQMENVLVVVLKETSACCHYGGRMFFGNLAKSEKKSSGTH